jgi:predicted nucleic acid-binding protein
VILYLDTSSLIKLYVAEAGSEEVRRLIGEAALVATSVVAYPETRSAIARLRREGALTAAQAERLRTDFERDWPHYLAVEVREPIWRRAGDLVERHALRGFDGLHLASFLSLRAAGPGDEVRFSAFDDRLNAAARAEAGG